MKSTSFRVLVYVALGILMTTGYVTELAAQRGGGGRGGGGRSAKSSSNVNRGGTARSGSSRQTASRPPSSTSRNTNPSNQPRASSQPRASNQSRAGHGSPARTTGRAGARRTTPRHTTTARRGRHHRPRRVHHSRRWRRGRWHHHRFHHHRRWYGGFWVGRFIIRTATFIAIANSASSNNYVVYGTTYVHYNPWYRPVMYEGDEGHVLTAPPVGHQADALPEGETVTFEGQTYTYADWGFWQPSGNGYVVVEPPVGAEVSKIPEDAVAHDDEGEDTIYQFDRSYYSKSTNDAGKTVYVVEPQPPEEEIDTIPAGSPSFLADGETYYYVDFNLYVAYNENGATGYVNGEPELGAQADALPEGATEIEYEGVTYHQFDMVFFEEVEDENGKPFYEVVDSPGDDEVTEIESS